MNKSRLIDWFRYAHDARLALFLVLAFWVRFQLYRDFPIFLTLDSADFVNASADIAARLDFRSDALGAWRLPGYPVFLAFTAPLTGWNSQNIVLLQAFVGIGSVALGLAIGRLLRSRLLTEAMVLILGLNPVYLLSEHSLMTESLFLLTLLAFSVLVLACLVGGIDLFKGLALGVVSGICMLTRSNGSLFCIPLVVAVFLVRLVSPGRFRWLADLKADRLRFALGFLAAVLLVLGPWAWRNYSMFGSATPFTMNVNRNLLIYQSQHDLLDTSLPTMQRFRRSYDPERHTIYALLFALGKTTVGSERVAGEIVREQIAHHPWRYLEEVARAFLNFGGYLKPSPGRNDVYSWFETVVSRVEYLDKVNSVFVFDPERTEFEYVSMTKDTPFTKLWSRLGTFFLGKIRLVLFLLFGVCFLAYLVRHRLKVVGVTDVVILAFGGAYLITVLAHSLTLSDYDRFAAPFDWILVMVVSLIVPKLYGARLGRVELHG